MTDAPKSPPMMQEVSRVDNGPLVFVVQNPFTYDRTARGFVPKVDISPAAIFGDLVEVLSPTAAPFNFPGLSDDLHRKLSHYRDGDFILLVGNPALIGAVTALASSYNDGRVTCLQWSGKDQRYIPIEMCDLWAREDN